MSTNYQSMLDRLDLDHLSYTGSEHFTFRKEEIDRTLLDFWSWSFSDLRNNVYRGIMAEYIVATALHLTPPQGNFSRVAWSPFDLLANSGKRIEVKSAAYLQSWTEELTRISFSVAPALSYQDGTASYGQTAQRNSDVYVFCLFTAQTRNIPLFDLDYWQFRVVPTPVLDDRIPKQKNITLDSLDRLIRSYRNLSAADNTFVLFDRLCEAVECL